MHNDVTHAQSVGSAKGTKSQLSVVINTKNAAQLTPHHRFEATLESVKFADELIVVDMHSQDETVEIARSYTDHVFQHPDVGFVEPARNFALQKARGEWILVLDADEEISQTLKTKIQTLIAGDATADAYYIPRKNIVFGTWYHYAGWWPDYQLRLFRRGSVEWSDKIHSVPVVSGSSDYLAKKEDFSIIHHNYQSIAQFLERLNRYTTHEVISRKPTKPSPHELVGAFEAELCARLFKHEGLRGGMHGVSISFLQSFYEVVVKLKQWEAAGFPKVDSSRATLGSLESLRDSLDYWIFEQKISTASGVRRLWLRFTRGVRRRLGV